MASIRIGPNSGSQCRSSAVAFFALVLVRQLCSTDRRHSSTPIDGQVVEQVIANRATIGDDQADAVRLVCGIDRAVSVIIGPAGTGKTFTLDAVRDAYSNSSSNPDSWPTHPACSVINSTGPANR